MRHYFWMSGYWRANGPLYAYKAAFEYYRHVVADPSVKAGVDKAVVGERDFGYFGEHVTLLFCTGGRCRDVVF